MRRLVALLVVLAVVFAGSTVVPRPADATSPGYRSRIVFVSDRDQANGEIYTIDTRHLEAGWTRLTSKNTAYEMDPEWQPNGMTIAYVSDKSGVRDVWTIGASGSGETNLTKDSASETGLSWSPDGTRIAYASSESAGKWDIWVMGADGSGKTHLTSFDHSMLGYPAWSPDGSKIAFVSMTQTSMDIFVMDADGSNVEQLTDSSVTNPFGGSVPSWSPDGSQIAYLAAKGTGSRQIYVMDADGSHRHAVTTGGGSKEGPSWSPDGNYIAFSSDADGDWDLWLVEPDGSDLGQITNDPGDESDVSWESVNRNPAVIDDGPFTVVRGGTLIGPSVLSNDTDPDGDALTDPVVSSGPVHASRFLLNPDGTFRYVHDGSAEASDSFTYWATDVRGAISGMLATVSITISTPPPPVVGDTVGLVDPGSGVWRLRNQAGVVSQFYYGNPGDYPFMGDWDCDGVDTPGLYRQSDGFAYLRNANSVGVADTSFFFGNPGDVPIAGDFNNDGCDTLSIYRPANQRFYVINELGKDGGGLGAADYEFLFGNPGDSPVVGDWDGDGTDEIGLYRESSGFFYYRNTLSTGVADGEFFFGDPGDRFVAGDWGVVDGRETPGLFRPSNVTFFFRHTLTQGTADSQFTWTGAGDGWLPVAGDFGL